MESVLERIRTIGNGICSHKKIKTRLPILNLKQTFSNSGWKTPETFAWTRRVCCRAKKDYSTLKWALSFSGLRVCKRNLRCFNKYHRYLQLSLRKKKSSKWFSLILCRRHFIADTLFPMGGRKEFLLKANQARDILLRMLVTNSSRHITVTLVNLTRHWVIRPLTSCSWIPRQAIEYRFNWPSTMLTQHPKTDFINWPNGKLCHKNLFICRFIKVF